MKLLQLGSSGDDVKQWQLFLTGQGLYKDLVNGKFEESTKAASQAFQQSQGLEPDGRIGNKSLGAAMLLGFGVIPDKGDAKDSANWPSKPSFPPLISNDQRASLFGKFSYRSKPLPINPENIEVTDNWVKENIIVLKIPQLVKIKGSDKVEFHKKAGAQMQQLWKDWESEDLLHLVLTWSGSYGPRYVRGSKTVLSNHSFGSAFDINYDWNKLGAIPALVGTKGSVRELVEIANDNGFYWGGHFSRLDGMHFEIAKIK